MTLIEDLEKWLENERIKYPNNMLTFDTPEHWQEIGELRMLMRVLQWINNNEDYYPEVQSDDTENV